MTWNRNLALGAAVLLAAACGPNGAGAPAEAHGDKSHGAAPASAEADGVDPTAAVSGVYVTDPGHRYITFTYTHQGYSKPYLRWRDWNGTLDWNAEDPAQSTVSVTIDANSVDSGVDDLDEHLRSEDFFDVAAFPQITFESTAVERTGPGMGKITGDLTIKGRTHPVTLDAKLNRAAYDERGGVHKIGFSATTRLMRADFDVDLYAPFVSDEVDVIIEAEFVSETAE